MYDILKISYDQFLGLDFSYSKATLADGIGKSSYSKLALMFDWTNVFVQYFFIPERNIFFKFSHLYQTASGSQDSVRSRQIFDCFVILIYECFEIPSDDYFGLVKVLNHWTLTVEQH